MNFEILDIRKPKNAKINIDFIDGLLSKNIINDNLYDKIFFKVLIKPHDGHDGDFTNLLYRKLWESTYIKTGYSHYHEDLNEIHLTITLSEVIGFIYKATPPRIKNQISDSITSIDLIFEILKQFLMDDNGGHLITYLSIFKNHIHFEPFETSWNCDVTPISLLRKHVPMGLLGYVVYSSMPFEDIISNKYLGVDKVTNIQMIVNAETENQAKRLCCMFNKNSNNTDLVISNIKYDEHDTYNMYVMVHGVLITINDDLKEFISSSYGDLIK